MSAKRGGSKTGLEPIAKRVPIRGKIDLQFPTFEGLVTAVSSNLSTTGMFIQTESPEIIGTQFSFQIRIEEWSPVQGNAEVIWTRAQADGPERPSGMGVQFVDLDAQSRRMIRWLVDKHLEGGGQPFDLASVPSGASKLRSRQAFPQPLGSKKRGPGKGPGGIQRRLLGGLVLLLLFSAGYAAYRSWFGNQPGHGALQPPSASEAIPDEGGSASPPGEEQAETITALEAATTSVSAEAVMSFIQNWAAAWESRDPVQLIGFYSDRFEASSYGGRESWEAGIRQQMRDAEFIRIAVSALEITFPTADAARASFFRSFRSNRSDETRRMILDLEPVDDGWKIRDQRSAD